MDVWGVLHLTDVGAIVGELDLLNFNGGITTHDIPGPLDSSPKNAFHGWIWFLLVVEQLQGELDIYLKQSQNLVRLQQIKKSYQIKIPVAKEETII